MASIILFFVTALIAISIFATNQTAVKPNKNILLGVTLPQYCLNNECVTSIVNKYKKSYTILILVSFLLSIPLIVVTSYPSFSIIYMFLWISLLLYFNNKAYMKYNRQLYALKQENDWFVGAKHIVTVDTAVSRIKNKMPVSKLWYIPSCILSVVPFIISLIKKDSLPTAQIILSLLPIALIFLFLYLHKLYSFDRIIVYSEITEINAACNYTYKRLWSICWVVIATVTSMGEVVFYLNLLSANSNNLLSILSCCLLGLVGIICIVYTHKKIRDTQSRLLSISDKAIYTDDDEYWIKGYYYNPNDSRTMVEKRVGYGFTYNLSTVKGKLMTYGITGGLVILLLFLSIMFVTFDTSDFKLSINGNIAKIDAPVYGYSFNIDDIEQVTEIDNVPDGGRTDGVSTGKYDLGNYNLNGYGKSKMYVHKGNPPFIVIKLKDIYVFINGKTKEITEQYYKILLENVKY